MALCDLLAPPPISKQHSKGAAPRALASARTTERGRIRRNSRAGLAALALTQPSQEREPPGGATGLRHAPSCCAGRGAVRAGACPFCTCGAQRGNNSVLQLFSPLFFLQQFQNAATANSGGLESKQGLTAPLLEYCFITHNQHCDLTAVLLCGFCGCKLTAPAAALPLASVLVSQQQAAHTDKPTHTLPRCILYRVREQALFPSFPKKSFWILESAE